MKRVFAGAILVALAQLTTVPASAAVRYDFTALSSFDGVTGSFSFTTSNFITQNLFVPAANLDNCTVLTPVGGSCTFSSAFFADTSTLSGSGTDTSDIIGFQVNFSQPAFVFANGAFGAFGTYQTIEFGSNQAGVLVVSQAGAIPEPASWAMMITGFGLVGAAMRRKAAARPSPAAVLGA